VIRGIVPVPSLLALEIKTERLAVQRPRWKSVMLIANKSATHWGAHHGVMAASQARHRCRGKPNVAKYIARGNATASQGWKTDFIITPRPSRRWTLFVVPTISFTLSTVDELHHDPTRPKHVDGSDRAARAPKGEDFAPVSPRLWLGK